MEKFEVRTTTGCDKLVSLYGNNIRHINWEQIQENVFGLLRASRILRMPVEYILNDDAKVVAGYIDRGSDERVVIIATDDGFHLGTVGELVGNRNKMPTCQIL